MNNIPQKSTILILLYNNFYDLDFNTNFNLGNFNVPGVKFTQDRSKLALADAVVFHTPGLLQQGEKFPNKYPEQLWVSWSIESEIHYPLIHHACFDITMTYAQDADVWVPYLASYSSTFVSAIKAAQFKKQDNCLVASFISSSYDKSGRSSYLTELNKYIKIHNYGTFLNNMDLKNDRGRETKLDVFKRYKFAIAFENSISPDYITEKFFDPFLTGTIPIYLGAPNIQDYAPGNNSFININDYPNPADLANLLITTQHDKLLYSGYLQWKNHSLNPVLLELVKKLNSLDPQFIRLTGLVKRYIDHKNRVSFNQSDDWRLIEYKNNFYLEDIRHGKSQRINETGVIVWQLLDSNHTIEQISNLIAKKYSLPCKQIFSDIYPLINKFYNLNMIKCSWLPN